MRRGKRASIAFEKIPPGLTVAGSIMIASIVATAHSLSGILRIVRQGRARFS